MTAMPTFLQPAWHPQASDLGGGLSGSRAKVEVDDFKMGCQEEDQWCWAAVAQAVERCCNTTEVSQSNIVDSHINPPPNCTPCGSGREKPHSLSEVLSERRLLISAKAGAPTFENIQRVIDDKRRPLPVRINWKDGGGHFICISGYRTDSDGGLRVIVYDPLVPGIGQGAVDKEIIAFREFVEGYEQRGLNGTPNYFYEVQ